MQNLPTLLLIAWLLPLASFAVICVGYSIPQMLGIRVRYSTQKYAGYIAIAAIVTGCVLSMVAMFGIWLPNHPLPTPSHHVEEQPDAVTAQTSPFHLALLQTEQAESGQKHGSNGPPKYVAGDWYSLGGF